MSSRLPITFLTLRPQMHMYAYTPSSIHIHIFCPIDSGPISKSAKKNQKRKEKKKAKLGVVHIPPVTTSIVQEEVKKEETPPPPPPPAPVDPIAEIKRQIEEAKAAKVSHGTNWE